MSLLLPNIFTNARVIEVSFAIVGQLIFKLIIFNILCFSSSVNCSKFFLYSDNPLIIGVLIVCFSKRKTPNELKFKKKTYFIHFHK